MGKPSRPSSSHPFASHPLNGRKILQSALLAGLAAGAGAGAIVAVKSLLFPHRTYEQEKAYLESLRSKGEKPYREPGFLQRNPRVTVYDDGNDPRTEGMVTYRIGPAQLSVSSLEENQGEEVEGNRGEEADSGLTLLYLHGGTFLSTLSPHQARLLFRLTRMLKGQALVPEFPGCLSTRSRKASPLPRRSTAITRPIIPIGPSSFWPIAPAPPWPWV